MDKLSREEALDLYIRTRSVSDSALLLHHNFTNNYLAEEAAENFERLRDLVQRIEAARLYRRALAERAA